MEQLCIECLATREELSCSFVLPCDLCERAFMVRDLYAVGKEIVCTMCNSECPECECIVPAFGMVMKGGVKYCYECGVAQ